MKINFYIIIFAFFCFQAKIFAQSEKNYYDDIVIFKTKMQKAECKNLEKYLSNLNDFSISEEIKTKKDKAYSSINNIYRLKFSKNTDINKITKELSLLPEIEYAEPLYKIYPLYSVNDYYSQTNQYWISLISADKAWDICKGDTNTVIGISDTGIDLYHDEFVNQIKYNYSDKIDGIDNDNDGYIDNFYGWDFGDNDNNPQYETSDHGVVVSGISSAKTNNLIGVAGSGFNCKFLPLKIADTNNNLVNGYQSILYAAEHGCKVVNCSWGSEFYQQMGQDIINYVNENYDLLVVAGAGNTASETLFYPGSYENVLSATGTFANDNIWRPNSPTGGGSTYSYTVDIAAPCGAYYSTYTNNSYGTAYQGTSYSSPIVAGCAGILRTYFPDYNARQIEEIIRISSDNIDTIESNIPYVGKMGSGRINLYKALTMQATASIRFHNHEINYDENKITINGHFTNYLANANNLTITAILHSDNAELLTSSIFSGNLTTLEDYFSENKIIINVFETAELGEIATLELIYSGDNYNATQNIYVKLKKEYIDISTDLMTLSVVGNGRLAFNDLNAKNGNGLCFDNNYDILSECSIIAGNSINNIFSSSLQKSDFKTFTPPTEINDNIYNFFDNNIYTDFDDSKDLAPLGMKFKQNIYSKKGEKYKNFFIVDYEITNSSNNNINDYYFAIFCDWDLIVPAKNSTEFNPEKNFLYCKYENNNKSLYAGIKLLGKQSANNVAFPIHENNDYINITNGFSNDEKFAVISTPFLNDDTENTDIASSVSAGPFNISPNETVKVSFAIIAAENKDDFFDAVDLTNKINNVLYNGKAVDDNENLVVIPSIADNIIDVFLKSNDSDTQKDNYKLEIVNSNGQIVLSSNFNNYNSFYIDNLNSGVYTVKIKNDNNCFSSKFIKK